MHCVVGRQTLQVASFCVATRGNEQVGWLMIEGSLTYCNIAKFTENSYFFLVCPILTESDPSMT